MKVDDGISTQGAFLVNCTQSVRQGIFVECRKLCLCSIILFYKPNTQEVTRLDCLLVLRDPELSLSGIKIKQKVSLVMSLLDCLS